MEGAQNLYYALGELAFVVAKADGAIQASEKQKLHDIVVEESKKYGIDFDYSEIIFKVLDNSEETVEMAYNDAIKHMEKYKNLLTSELANNFLTILQKVAAAFGDITIEEEDFITKVKRDIIALL